MKYSEYQIRTLVERLDLVAHADQNSVVIMKAGKIYWNTFE